MCELFRIISNVYSFTHWYNVLNIDIALSNFLKIKDTLRTFQPENHWNLRTSQPEKYFAGSYKKKCRGTLNKSSEHYYKQNLCIFYIKHLFECKINYSSIHFWECYGYFYAGYTRRMIYLTTTVYRVTYTLNSRF